MAKAVKLADIAEQLGVSTVTVSKALSGQKGVSEAMREKIKREAPSPSNWTPGNRKNKQISEIAPVFQPFSVIILLEYQKGAAVCARILAPNPGFILSPSSSSAPMTNTERPTP